MRPKPCSPAAERNKLPLLTILRRYLKSGQTILEIGSGTGQHAVYFAEQMPDIIWQPSDRSDNIATIEAWVSDAQLDNVLTPLLLDVREKQWPIDRADCVFSANTAHIMAWSSVEKMFKGVARILPKDGLFFLYGPFKDHQQYTSESNRTFNDMLRQRDPKSGLRDLVDLMSLAKRYKLKLIHNYKMPANNQLLVWIVEEES